MAVAARSAKPALGYDAQDAKAGDHYLRSLLVMGARAVLNSIGDKQDYFSWLCAGSGCAPGLLARGGGDCREECARELGGVALW